MLTEAFFYCIFWIVAVSIIWFYTDTVLYYSQLFGLFRILRLEYTSYIKANPTKYFPDFLFQKSLDTNNKLLKFLYKLLSCPFCTTVWLSVLGAIVLHNLFLIAPLYVISIVLLLGIKNLF
jgi:hypothetical protein